RLRRRHRHAGHDEVRRQARQGSRSSRADDQSEDRHGHLRRAKAVKESKAGKVEFRVDKAGIVHCPVGKINFEAAKLAENAHALIGAVVKAKPAAAKGKYVKKITLTSTMGPAITVDLAEAETAVATAA